MLKTKLPLKQKVKKDTPEKKIKWLTPTDFAPLFGKTPATILSYIRKEQAGIKLTPFEWTIDPNNDERFLIKYDPANPPKKLIDPNGEDIKTFVEKQAGINREDIIKKMQGLADTDQKIKEQKLKKLEIENKEKEGKYVDKEKFNRDFYQFQRTFRNKVQNFPRKYRVMKSKLSDHEFEQRMIDDFDKLFKELSKFKYYDSDNNPN